jgi:hypothetical protein
MHTCIHLPVCVCKPTHIHIYISKSTGFSSLFSGGSEWVLGLSSSLGLKWQASWCSRLGSAGELGPQRDRWTFCASVNMLWALGESDWQLSKRYWGKHCPFFMSSSLARDHHVDCISTSSGTQVHYVSTFRPRLQQARELDQLAAWFTSAFAGILSSGQWAANQNNRRLCVLPSKALGGGCCTCSGQWHALPLASELSVLQTLEGLGWMHGNSVWSAKVWLFLIKIPKHGWHSLF